MPHGRSAAVAALGGTLEERVAAFVRRQRLPGAAAGVVVGDELVWSFAPPVRDRPVSPAEVPAATPESTAMSRAGTTLTTSGRSPICRCQNIR